MLRFAMIGAGGHASQSIYPALRFTDLELVAVADLDEERAAAVGGRFGSPRIYGDLDKMLENEELDAVGVVGPPALHHQAGLAVLRSGRHLFMEKPPANDLAGARELQQAARDAGVQAMVGFMKRHAKTYVHAKEISQRPEFGRLTTLRLNYSHWHYRPLREHLIFMSTHALDLTRFFMGDVVDGSVLKRDIDGNFVIALLLQHTDGGASQVTLSAHEPRVQESVELAGESTLIQVRNLTDLRYHHPAPEIMDAFGTDESMMSTWFPELTIPMQDADNHVLQGYAGELRHFAEAIAAGSAVSPNIEDGVEAMRMVEALVEAPEGISPLRLPD
jgi:predicted dehydrogenase